MRKVTRVSPRGGASANSTLQLLLDPESSKEDTCQKDMLPFSQIPVNQWAAHGLIGKHFKGMGSRRKQILRNLG